MSDGHALLITRAHRATWFAATDAERHELTEAIQLAREAIRAQYPDVNDFNIGLNVGADAGQTVFHVHLHVIPRRRGDVPDARGGVRNVIPSRRLYGRHLPQTTKSPALLTTGEDFPLLPHLGRELERATQLDVAVAFVMPSGVDKLYPHLEDLLARGGTFRLVTGDYLDITDPDALRQLMDLALAFPKARVDLRVFHKPGTSFHPKAYILDSGGEQVAFIGSSNVSSSALLEGVEWNYRIVTSKESDGLSQIRGAFDALLAHPSVRPIDELWLRAYEARRRLRPSMPLPDVADAEVEQPLPPPIPNPVQVEALEALKDTRAAGFRAGLVVMATGLGKTWLAAFDTESFKRVLFVAHREEILTQALHTFRRVRSHAKFGRFNGEEKAPDAEVLFASIATLSRQAHLDAFDPKAFDYIVVDEFHHASAGTYRRLIEYFEPRFLLGLTATPHRTDGDDLLGLCQENLVFECGVVQGITQGLLAPFAYFGVPDTIDYENIPWRSSRFDEAALTEAAATSARAQNALEQWRERAGQRTLAFCVSQVHADFMREYFTKAGVRCAAVHSGPASDPRQGSLEHLAAGSLKVLFAVDMFNEGVDLPAIDTVMMLRPTESAIIWLQQFGRGLRISPGKERLTVIDYIGNHRSFLLKARTLLQVPPGNDAELNAALLSLAEDKHELPPGCSVTYELRALEIMRALMRLPTAENQDALLAYYADFKERRGERPTALQALHDGYVPRSARRKSGSWIEFVEQQGDLDAGQARARSTLADFLRTLESTPMTRSYKMVTVLALLNRKAIPGAGLSVAELMEEVIRVALNDPRLTADFGEALQNERALRKLLEQNPIAAWVNGEGTGGTSFFSYEAGVFRLRAESSEGESAQDLIREIVEWRLAEYLRRLRDVDGSFTLKVSHSGGKPILRYPAVSDGIPKDWTTVQINGRPHQANFKKIALNVVHRHGETTNELPTILREWFGRDAGLPGTNRQVSLTKRDGGWTLEKLAPVERRGPELWRTYSREEIPALFGETFDSAWKKDLVILPARNPKRVFLLANAGSGAHFLAPDLFEWQSDATTTKRSAQARLLEDHVERGIDVQLFVRDREDPALPFVYCGPVTFRTWRSERPITVEWTLGGLLPDRFFTHLRNDGTRVPD